MIVKFAKNATETQVRAVAEQLRAMGAAFVYRRLYGFPVFALNKPLTPEQTFHFDSLPGVEEIIPIEQEYRLASSRWKQERTIIDVRGARIGGDEICVIAGPCAIESEEQIFQTAENLHRLGVKFIRGGAYKPRTSPYSFQGLGKDGLRLIKEAADAYGLRVVTEVMDSSLIDEVLPFADILQVGSRNMQNFYFLKQLGQAEKPILLKRGMQARVDEWLMAAEYLLTYGNENVILCERGIRTFDTAVRNTMDIAAIPLVKSLSHLPVIADPSHGTGIRSLVEPLSLAAIAAGADGLIIEIHPDPARALSDGPQSLNLNEFGKLLSRAMPVAESIGRQLDLNKAKVSLQNADH